MRLAALLAIIIALCPGFAGASGKCEVTLSELAAREDTTLKGPLRVEEVEFGLSGASEDWIGTVRKFMALMRPGDEIYHRDDNFNKRFWSSYFIVVRDGCVIHTLTESIE